MIGFLRGILFEKDAPNLIVEVNGIGYEVQLSMNNFSHLPPVGQEIALYIHMITRDDGEYLYGFINREQRSLFRALIKISGVGPKIALAILSVMEPNIFVQHLASNDADAFERVPGIGAKMARRLLVEMRDKISEWESMGVSGDNSGGAAMSDAVSALISLGYKQHEIHRVLLAHKDDILSSEELVRLALKKIR